MGNYCASCSIKIDEDEIYCDDCVGYHVDTWMCPCCDYQNEEEDETCQGDGCNCERPPRPW